MPTSRTARLAAAVCALGLLAIVPRPACAQQDAQPVVYASYFDCNPAGLSRVDSQMRSFWEPIFDNQVANGRVTAYGWLGHHTGGSWDRVAYTVSPDVASALAAVEAVGAEAEAANAKAVAEFDSVCSSHVDYIWQRVAGSQPATELAAARPAAGLSVYYECNPAREELADHFVTTAFAPTLDGLVQSGDLNSWSWMRHLVGGKYRRILVTDGRDAAAVIEAIGKLVTRLQAEQPHALREFGEACDSHQDNVWNVLVSKP